ncbi:hypothetical protein ACFFJB_10035 [Camelimonas abortus]|uniref:Cell division protein FtsL n=1 Tax=Camelimonas abortus TaxID=1017184 RepID=A0ABV7LGW7_9HYPH
MIIRIFHIVAIVALLASAGYAYSIKYDTVYLAEQVAKLKGQIRREKDLHAVLAAEWQRLVRPERLQVLAERHLDLQPLAISQLARFGDLPQRQEKIDAIGRKLADLGLAEPTNTPSVASGATAAPAARDAARTPGR